MAKLSQLLRLEEILNAYDGMPTSDARYAAYQGKYVGSLLDEIIAKLVRHLNSKTTLSCRNVLADHFETMKDTAYWLKCKLFVDLPEAMGNELREKIVRMVDLLKTLMMKILDVEAGFVGRLLERMKNIYMKNTRTTDYELWKRRHPKLTMERLTEYQAELTADMLIMGVLKHDDEPSGQEMDDVDMVMLRKKLKKGKALPEGFETECAKLRRYSYWNGKMFMIDFELFHNYFYRMYSLLPCEQRKAMYDYKVQMTQIHEDMRKLMKEHEEDELKEERKMKEEEMEEERFHFIHPEIEDDEAWRIHDAVKRLVANQRIPEICAYLKEQKKKGMLMLPSIPSVMYNELVRLGMPQGEGFTEKHFRNSYMK